MELTAVAILPGLGMGTGLYLCGKVLATRPSKLETAVYNYLPQAKQPTKTGVHPLQWLRPLWESLGSTAESVERRLEILGNPQDLATFRLFQLMLSTVTALTVGLGLAVLSAYRPISLLQWLVATILAFIITTVLWDRLLSARVATFGKKLSYQVADAAELLALAISAGESVPGALNRVASISGPQMRSQLESALNQISQGTPVSKALRKLAKQTPSPQLQRLLDTLVSGAERGAALSEILRHQAHDLRDEAMRSLLEAGGRKEITMLLPVVFIILPVTVIFALYPGLIALRF